MTDTHADADAWIAALPDARRTDTGIIDAWIRAIAPGLRRYVDRGFLDGARIVSGGG